MLESFGNEDLEFKSQIPLENVIYEGSYLVWDSALKNPDSYAGWVIMRTDLVSTDKVWASLRGTPQLNDSFTQVYKNERIEIYQRTATRPAEDSSMPISQATSVVTIAVPSPSATVATTAPVLPTPVPLTPTAQVPMPLDMARSAETGLHSGKIDAQIDYGNGTRSSLSMRFVRGGANGPPRLYTTTTYQGATGNRTTDQVTIGGQSWQRGIDGHWALNPMPQDVEQQLQPFLAHVSTATAAVVTDEGPRKSLRWDTAEAAFILSTDPTTGQHLTLHIEARASGVSTQIQYTQWNAPIDITAPSIVIPEATLPGTTQAINTPSGLPEPKAVVTGEAAEMPVFTATDQITVKASVNLRSGPGVQYQSLGLLVSGTLLEATGETVIIDGLQWRRFQTVDHRVGWIRDIDTASADPH